MTAITDEFVATAQRAQELTTAAVRTWVETTKQYGEQVTVENPLPRPEQVRTTVDAWFDLASGLLAEQRTLAKTLVDAGTEAAATVTEQARAAAAAVPANPFVTAAAGEAPAPAAESAKRARTTRSTTA